MHEGTDSGRPMDTWLGTTRVLAAMLMILLVNPNQGVAQDVEVLELGVPSVEYARQFSRIVGVVEISPGNVVVADNLERTIEVLSDGGASIQELGGMGQGPEEYLSVGRLFSTGIGRFGVEDPMLDRVLMFGPDLQHVGTVSRRGCSGGHVPRPEPLVASDFSGRFYAEAQLTRPNAQGDFIATETAAIERWEPIDSCSRDTIAYYGEHKIPSAAA